METQGTSAARHAYAALALQIHEGDAVAAAATCREAARWWDDYAAESPVYRRRAADWRWAAHYLEQLGGGVA